MNLATLPWQNLMLQPLLVMVGLEKVVLPVGWTIIWISNDMANCGPLVKIGIRNHLYYISPIASTDDVPQNI